MVGRFAVRDVAAFRLQADEEIAVLGDGEGDDAAGEGGVVFGRAPCGCYGIAHGLRKGGERRRVIRERPRIIMAYHPLTLSLSLWERGRCGNGRGLLPWLWESGRCVAAGTACSLSLGERVGVRGNAARSGHEPLDELPPARRYPAYRVTRLGQMPRNAQRACRAVEPDGMSDLVGPAGIGGKNESQLPVPARCPAQAHPGQCKPCDVRDSLSVRPVEDGAGGGAVLEGDGASE